MKLNKKILLLSVTIGILLLGINYTFCYPTKINKFIATKIYNEPANSYFDDDNFYQCVVDNYNEQNNGTYSYTTNLTDEELKKINKLDCYNKKITNVDGIEKITSLTSLDLNSNKLVSLDVSTNTKLKYLKVNRNQLTSLNLDNNKELIYLDATVNQLTELDVSNNTALTELYLWSNQLTELDLSNNSELEKLMIGTNEFYVSAENKVSELDLSQNKKLTILDISDNKFSKLDLTANIGLIELYAEGNNLTELDVSKNINLATLNISSNQITKLDISNNTVINNLDISDNQLSSVDVSKNISLKTLHIYGNQLTKLDVSKNIELTELIVYWNKLTSLDVSKNVDLTELKIGNHNFNTYDENEITQIDLSANQLLKTLDVGNNQLTELDVSHNTELKELYVNRNKLTSLDVSKNTKLEKLDILYNEFGETLYTYKNNSIIVNNPIKIPSQLGWGTPKWTSNDTNIATVDEDGNVTTHKSGAVQIEGIVSEKYETTSIINIVEITSDKYTIDDENDYILLGSDNNINNIKSNINVSHDNIDIDINFDNYKLYVKYKEEILKEFDIVGVSSEEYDLNNDYILSGGNTDLEKINVVNGNIVLEDNLIKIKHGDKVIKTFYESSFDDQNFYNCVIDAYNLVNVDVNYNYSLTDEQLNTITRIQCNGHEKSYEDKIVSVKGLEKITSLTDLEIYDHLLTDIDVSKNTKLVRLNLSSNQLTKIDVSKNAKLDTLSVNSNRLFEIDVSNNKALTYLGVANNQLTSIDVSNNKELTNLFVYENKLKNLDVSNNDELTSLDAYSNQLTELDVSNNTKLTRLLVNNNQLIEIDLANNSKLNSLLIYDNPYKETLFIYKENDIVVGNNVKLPEQLKWNSPTWTTKDSSIATVSSDGSVSTLKSGTVNISGSVSGKYNTTSTINVVEITSDKYIIDGENDYIYVGLDDNVDTIQNNIKSSNENITIDIDLENKKLYVMHDANILKEFKLVSISSDVYDLRNDYIYVSNLKDEEIIAQINVINCNMNIYDNQLQIVYNGQVVDEYELIRVLSDKLTILDSNKVYVSNKDKEEILDDINILNGTSIIENDKIKILFNDNIVGELQLLSIDLGNLSEASKIIVISEDIAYNAFTDNITMSSGLTYKIFNGTNEVTSGNVEKDMVLKVYYNDEKIDSFNITDEYLYFDESLSVDEDSKYLSNIGFDTSVNSIIEQIDTTGQVVITNKNNEVLAENSLIGTGSVVTIKLSKETYQYKVIINGDIDGDGRLKLSDVMKMANYIYKDKSSLSGVFLEAADFDKNGIYNLQDIMKSAKSLYGGN